MKSNLKFSLIVLFTLSNLYSAMGQGIRDLEYVGWSPFVYVQNVHSTSFGGGVAIDFTERSNRFLKTQLLTSIGYSPKHSELRAGNEFGTGTSMIYYLGATSYLGRTNFFIESGYVLDVGRYKGPMWVSNPNSVDWYDRSVIRNSEMSDIRNVIFVNSIGYTLNTYKVNCNFQLGFQIWFIENELSRFNYFGVNSSSNDLYFSQSPIHVRMSFNYVK